MHTDTIQEQLNHFIKSTRALTGDELAHAKAAFAQYVDSTTKSLDAIGSSISDHAKTSVKAGNDYAHAHPWQLAAIGTGMLLLGLGAKRMKKKRCC